MTSSRTSNGARHSAEEWRTLMTRFGRSGLNIAAFCQHESNQRSQLLPMARFARRKSPSLSLRIAFRFFGLASLY